MGGDRIAANRIASGAAELAACRSTVPFLKQVTVKPGGETVWDLSAPVMVNGRHWGCVRLGITMAETGRRRSGERSSWRRSSPTPSPPVG